MSAAGLRALLADLVTVLADAGLSPTALEVAEAVWLAQHITAHDPANGVSDVAARPRPDDETVETMPPVPAEPVPDPPMDTLKAIAPPDAGQTTQGRGGWMPQAPALPDRSDILRALRPLKHQRPGRGRSRLDEHATATFIAETRMWIPVMRPTVERWLDVAVIVDGATSMSVWRPLAAELVAMFTQLGAFRDVRLWRLADDGTLVSPGGIAHRPEWLIAPNGRRMYVVLTDGADPQWHDGRWPAVLGTWSVTGPVVVLQPLPERMWSRTGLRTQPGQFRPRPTGARYDRPRFAVRRRGTYRPLADATQAVPVLRIKPPWFEAWARLVVGSDARPIELSASVIDVSSMHLDRPGTAATTPQSAEQHVQIFRTVASPAAYRLAVCLSVVPLTVPVMSLVQHLIEPGSGPETLAEVIIGGLLTHVAEDTYDFLPGVRQTLLGRLRRSEAALVLSSVTRYLTDRDSMLGPTFPVVAARDDGGPVRTLPESLGWLPPDVAARWDRPARAAADIRADTGSGPAAAAIDDRLAPELVAMYSRYVDLLAPDTHPTDAGPLTITVRTAVPVSRPRIVALARAAVHRHRPGTAVTVNLAVDPMLPPPGYTITITPEPWTIVLPISASPDPAIAFETTIESLVFRFRLSHRAWLQFGRGPDLPDGQLALPDHLVTIPRGALVEIRAESDGRCLLRRRSARSDFAVVVDGRRLAWDEVVPMADGGTIEYLASDGQATTMQYRLSRSTTPPPASIQPLADPATSHAVIVGVAEYRALPALPSIAASAQALASALTDPDVWGLPPENCYVILNPTDPRGVLEPLHAAASKCRAALFVYFAGHSLTINSEAYLALSNTTVDQPWTALPYHHLSRLMAESAANARVMILDTCDTGSRRPDGRADDFEPAEGWEARGTHVMRSANPAPADFASPGEPTSFTAALLDLMNNGVPGEREVMSLDLIYQQLRRSLTAEGRLQLSRYTAMDTHQVGLIRNRAASAPAAPNPRRPAAFGVDPVTNARLAIDGLGPGIAVTWTWPSDAAAVEVTQFRRGGASYVQRVTRPQYLAVGCRIPSGPETAQASLRSVAPGTRGEVFSPPVALSLTPPSRADVSEFHHDAVRLSCSFRRVGVFNRRTYELAVTVDRPARNVELEVQAIDPSNPSMVENIARYVGLSLVPGAPFVASLQLPLGLARPFHLKVLAYSLDAELRPVGSLLVR
nr:hypothetical protein GCM10020063_036970 [Dactylosporangium thailandense]